MEQLAADILEVGVDALRAELVEHRAVVLLGAVVEAGVVARLAHGPHALVLVAGAAHHLGAGELGELARHLADRAGRRRDEHRLARLGLADVLHAVPGGESGHAEHAEIGRERHAARFDLAQALAVMDGMARPVEHADHQVALGERGVLRLHHLTDRAAGQRLAERERRRVGAHLGHARPHVGIERQEAAAHQHLAVAERRQGDGLLAEAVGGDVAGRALGEDDLGGFGHGHLSKDLASQRIRSDGSPADRAGH